MVYIIELYQISIEFMYVICRLIMLHVITVVQSFSLTNNFNIDGPLIKMYVQF